MTVADWSYVARRKIAKPLELLSQIRNSLSARTTGVMGRMTGDSIGEPPRRMVTGPCRSDLRFGLLVYGMLEVSQGSYILLAEAATTGAPTAGRLI